MNKQEIINSIDSAIKRRYERFDRLFVKAKGVGFEEAENGLYRYEKSVTDEARRIAVYVVEKGGSWEEWWKKLSDGCNDSYDFVQNLIKDGYTGWWDGHSGNSGRPQFFSRGAFYQGPTFSSISTVRYLRLSAMPVIMTTVQI